MKERIEHKTSRTAEMTCSIRASSFFESEPCLKTNDYIAPRLLPTAILLFVKIKLLRTLFARIMAPAGVYEYVIARTRYIDSVVEESLKTGISQIVLLGAGFDSRAIRFYHTSANTSFFELDAAITQNAKIMQLQKRAISIPENVVFIPINFNKESIATKLLEYHFKNNEQSLFILEGITMYLDEKAVRYTLSSIKSLSARHSRIVFDFIYNSVLRKENTLYGEKDLYERVNKFKEAWRFGIEQDQIEAFLNELGLGLIKYSTAADLEQAYGFGTRRINGTHGLVIAEIL